MKAWTMVAIVMGLWLILKFSVNYNSNTTNLNTNNSNTYNSNGNYNNSNGNYNNSNGNYNSNTNNDASNMQRLRDNIYLYAQPPSRASITKNPYITGKVFVLSRDDSKDKYTDESPYDLRSANLLAKSPEDLGTIILLNYRKVFVGNYYTDSGKTVPGYTWRCEMTVIDNTIPAVIARRTFKGPPLEREVMINQYAYEITGDRPDSDVYEYLAGLPVR